MKFDKKDLLLYAVTDRRWLNGASLYEQVEQAIIGGATFIQLREKEMNQTDFLQEAIEIKALCRRCRVPFVIDDNVEVAVLADADGVHVGQSDMEAGNVREMIGRDKILGVSAQNAEQAVLAEKRGADYIGAGAVFPTTASPARGRLFRCSYSAALAARACSASSKASMRRAVACGDFVNRASML